MQCLNRLVARPVLAGLLAVSALWLGGCGTTGGGGEEAVAVKVEFAPRFNVEKALLAVFGGSGFQYTGESGGALIFQGSGGPAAQGRFGDWFGAGLEGKVVLVMTNPDYRTHVLSGRLYKSTTGPGGPWIPAPEGESGLKRLLKDVKDLARAM